VENFLQAAEALKDIPQERIFRFDAASIGVTSPELSAEARIDFATQMRSMSEDIYSAGTDVIHYFHSGPLPTIAVVAATLANGPLVRMYHWRQERYEDWGPIRAMSRSMLKRQERTLPVGTGYAASVCWSRPAAPACFA
jgi:hypothetical protein